MDFKTFLDFSEIFIAFLINILIFRFLIHFLSLVISLTSSSTGSSADEMNGGLSVHEHCSSPSDSDSSLIPATFDTGDDGRQRLIIIDKRLGEPVDLMLFAGFWREFWHDSIREEVWKIWEIGKKVGRNREKIEKKHEWMGKFEKNQNYENWKKKLFLIENCMFFFK